MASWHLSMIPARSCRDHHSFDLSRSECEIFEEAAEVFTAPSPFVANLTRFLCGAQSSSLSFSLSESSIEMMHRFLFLVSVARDEVLAKAVQNPMLNSDHSAAFIFAVLREATMSEGE